MQRIAQQRDITMRPSDAASQSGPTARAGGELPSLASVDPIADLGVFYAGPTGAPYIDRWMSATEVERAFGISVARVLALSDDPAQRFMAFPRGGLLPGSHRRVWRASAIADWMSRHAERV